jgi:hypothetical protein
MFPWSSEFTWDLPHVAFFGAFYAVLLAVAAVVLKSLADARADARSGLTSQVLWRAAFAELPARDRACRHRLSGRAPGRVCDNGFDCRSCETHPSLAGLPSTAAVPAEASTPVGMRLPRDRFYHRGHTFVKPEPDGTVTVGLDDLARRLVGPPDAVEPPSPGTHLGHGDAALRLRVRGSLVRVPSPLDGVVLGSVGSGAETELLIDPGGPLDTRHLLSGDEVAPWALRELERFQALLAPTGMGASMADGGELIEDVGRAVPPDRLDAVLGEMFLDL